MSQSRPNPQAHLIVNSNACIDFYPSPDQEHPADTKNQLTLGDVHGNMLNILYCVVRQNILLINEASYNELVRIYKTSIDELTAVDLEIFNKILEETKVNEPGILRLIGDELADRGTNDYFTLKIIEALCKKGVHLEIILSNHGFEFIESYEKYYIYQRFFSSSFPMENPKKRSFARSIYGMQKLIERNLIKPDEIFYIISNYYKPNLRILSYSINDAQSKITLYTHAPVDLYVIKALAKQMKVEYIDDSLKSLAKTINNINISFDLYKQANLVHTLDTPITRLNYNKIKPEIDTYPVHHLLWNISIDILSRPKIYHNYSIDYVHGHEKDGPTTDHIYNLDNQLGKSDRLHINEYRIHFSHETLAPKFVYKRASELSPSNTNSNIIEIFLLDEKVQDDPYSNTPYNSSYLKSSSSSSDIKQSEDCPLELKNNDLFLNENYLSLLYSGINEIKIFGISLSKTDTKQGKIVIDLSEELKNNVDNFFKDFPNKTPDISEISVFSANFIDLIYSKNGILNTTYQLSHMSSNLVTAITGFTLQAMMAGTNIIPGIVRGITLSLFSNSKRNTENDDSQDTSKNEKSQSTKKFKHK